MFIEKIIKPDEKLFILNLILNTLFIQQVYEKYN